MKKFRVLLMLAVLCVAAATAAQSTRAGCEIWQCEQSSCYPDYYECIYSNPGLGAGAYTTEEWNRWCNQWLSYCKMQCRELCGYDDPWW